jgi:4-diphosphocytidyl-2-C-methyl-D-erythritol kinase
MLRVVGRRPDGYHLLQTVFQFIDLSDELFFAVRDDGWVRRSNPLPGLDQESDLAVRAGRLLQRESGTYMGADIRLVKRLPMAGGLGGGSSDAATTLVALNRLWDVGFSLSALAHLGLQLGADVPVFVRGRAAWAEGVGEKLTPLVLPQSWFLIVAPACRTSTAEVFADPELTHGSPRTTIRDFLSGRVGNDCEPVARRRYPEVAAALDWLSTFGDARLTGTGSCVFAVFAEEASARYALSRLPAGWRAWIVQGLNRSPLYVPPPMSQNPAVR